MDNGREEIGVGKGSVVYSAGSAATIVSVFFVFLGKELYRVKSNTNKNRRGEKKADTGFPCLLFQSRTDFNRQLSIINYSC